MGWFRGMDTRVLYGRGNGYSTIACNPISTDAIYPIYHTLLSGALSTSLPPPPWPGARSLNARFNRVCATVPARPAPGLLSLGGARSAGEEGRGGERAKTVFFESRAKLRRRCRSARGRDRI